MRKIKLRAWDKKNKKMEYLSDNFTAHTIWFDIHEDGWECLTADTGDRKLVCGVDVNTGMDNGVLMQFTGLKDKNGKEIYEGDILIYPPVGIKLKEIDKSNDALMIHGIIKAQVVWNEEEAKFESVSNNGISDLMDDGIVIGNIYENPELLNPHQEKGI